MTVRFCTSVHYWRTPVAEWEHVLDRLSAAGLQGIDVYVPWNCHEVAPGRYDFGSDDPLLNLPRFLRLVSERGLWVLLRPGPQVNAELNNFGLPDRIVRDEKIQALGPRGRPVFCTSPPIFFPVPSYASERYMDEVETWFAAVGDAIGPLIEKASPIRLVQVDNETGLFFREAPFDQDYHQDALVLWGEWLDERGLPRRDPPLRREPGRDGLRSAMAWVRFRQWMMLRCLERFKESLARAGLDAAPFSHNTPPSGLWQPLRPSQLEKVVDVVGADIYASAARLAGARDQVLQLRGIGQEPFAAEMSCGTVYFAPAIDSFDNRFVTAASLAYGLKGFNLYMGVGRDRWIGGLVPQGGEREGADLLHFYQRLIRLMGTIGLRDLEPVAGAAVILPDDYVTHSLAAFPLPGGSPALLSALGLPVHEALAPDEWDLGEPVQSEWIRRLHDCQASLSESSIPYFLSPGDRPLDANLLVMAPTYRYLSARIVDTLLAHVESGGLVIAGPRDPELDGDLAALPKAIVERWRAARDGGGLLVADSLESKPAREMLSRTSRKVAETLPFETAIRAPLAEILPHRCPDEGRWISWIVTRGSGPGTRMVLEPRRGWQWIRRLSIKQKTTGGEFVQDRGGFGESLTLDISGLEAHLVEWRRGDAE
ncbi:MAG: beta-galactosidase [Deltaproteobacteria bacterium]|nr:beta-galactosidase [Deltaproteobacteria bacterium]